MKIVIDMNLSPQWVDVLMLEGYDCVHWSEIGSPNAPDREILLWARSNGYVVFTHDLDFGAILAATKADSPSVLQLRTQNISPKRIGEWVVSAFKQFEELHPYLETEDIDEALQYAAWRVEEIEVPVWTGAV
jgi:predicted nuclease of predicted toxin-antitoxin system